MSDRNKVYDVIVEHGTFALVGWNPIGRADADKVCMQFHKETYPPRAYLVRHEDRLDAVEVAKSQTSPLRLVFDMRDLNKRIAVWCQRHLLGYIKRHTHKTTQNKAIQGYYVLDPCAVLSVSLRPGSDEVLDAYIDQWQGSPLIANTSI